MVIVRNIFLVTLVCLFVVSCKSNNKGDVVIPDVELYRDGMSLVDSGKYKEASETFAKIYFQHPGSNFSVNGEIMEAYSLYLHGNYDEAIDVLTIFMHLHPAYKDIDYIYYMKALCQYMQISGVEYDQSKTELAKVAFEDVIQKFPDSEYAKDARVKMNLIEDFLANKSIKIGRFYLQQSNPIAAIGRFEHVVRYYQTTEYVQEALYRLVECYITLGLKDESMKYASVLGHNYSNSKWYKLSLDLLGQ